MFFCYSSGKSVCDNSATLITISPFSLTTHSYTTAGKLFLKLKGLVYSEVKFAVIIHTFRPSNFPSIFFLLQSNAYEFFKLHLKNHTEYTGNTKLLPIAFDDPLSSLMNLWKWTLFRTLLSLILSLGKQF